MKKWVLLDRDGVINYDSVNYIKSAAEWEPLPGSLEAIAILNRAGFSVGIATNQSGIARGLYTLETLHIIHQKMQDYVAKAGGHIHAIAYCPHGPDDGCDCRKPKPGLLQTLAKTHHFSLRHVPYIGDAERDVDAALAGGATPFLVLTGKGASTLKKNPEKLKDILIFENLLAASKFLVESLS